MAGYNQTITKGGTLFMSGTISRGIRAPIIRPKDDLVNIVVNSVLFDAKQQGYTIDDRDIIAVTEAVVAKAQGNYASTEQIASDVRAKLGRDLLR